MQWVAAFCVIIKVKYLEVVNLDKYQHYQSGRETIWVKVYLKIVRDYKFKQLNNSERWLFVGLITMAVECSNSVPYDALYVRDTCCYKSPNSVQRVREGLAKMVKLGLLLVKNAITERKTREDKEEKISSFKSKKPFYKVSGEEMRQDARGKWWVIPKVGGDWLEFVGSVKNDIIYK